MYPNSSNSYRLKYDVPSIVDASGIPVTSSGDFDAAYQCSKFKVTTVVKTNITLATSDPFGAVRRGELTLQYRGLLAGIILKREMDDQNGWERTIVLRIGAELFGGTLHLDDGGEFPIPYYFFTDSVLYGKNCQLFPRRLVRTIDSSNRAEKGGISSGWDV